MKRILLYSGGLDSLCAKRILEKQFNDLESVYFQIGTPYESDELAAVNAYNEKVMGPGRTITLKSLEVLDQSGFGGNYHIPMRNALLLMHTGIPALIENLTEEIHLYFPQILEIGRDKNSRFFGTLHKLFKVYNYNIKIHRPFKNWSKEKLIEESGLGMKWIDKYSYSCYTGGEPVCNKCFGCRHKQIAYLKLGWITLEEFRKESDFTNPEFAKDIWKYKGVFHWKDTLQLMRLAWYEWKNRRLLDK